MSTTGKIFIVLAIIGSLGSAAGGFFLAQKKSGYATQLSQAEQALRAPDAAVPYIGDFLTNPAEPAATILKANAAFTKTTEELAEVRETLASTQADLTNSQAQVARLTTEVATVQNQLEETETNLTNVKAQLETTSNELAQITDLLGGRDLSAVLTQNKEIQEKILVLESEKKLIEDTLMQKQERIDEFEQLDRLRKAKSAPLQLSGKVVAINKAWNFVVLDVGKNKQLVEGIDLTVYRGDTLIGKIRSVSVEQDTAIADILPEWSQAEIQVGDQVLF